MHLRRAREGDDLGHLARGGINRHCDCNTQLVARDGTLWQQLTKRVEDEVDAHQHAIGANDGDLLLET